MGKKCPYLTLLTCFEVCYVRYWYSYECLFLHYSCLEFLFLFFYPKVGICCWLSMFLGGAKRWIPFTNPTCLCLTFYCEIETINIQSYSWRVNNASRHFVYLVMFSQIHLDSCPSNFYLFSQTSWVYLVFTSYWSNPSNSFCRDIL